MPTGRRRRKRGRSLFRRLWFYTEVTFLLLFVIALAVVGSAFYSVIRILPSGADISGYEPTQSTKIFSSDGVLLANIYEENREVVPIDDIPKDLQNATVAIEDERFYKHPGVDLRGIVRSLYQNIRRGHTAQGGSTLTQQLARNIYLSRERSVSRKLKEILLALELERNFSKEQILELYMNQVYYGSGAYGVQTAATLYFGKDVKDLTLAECALLAGLPQKPSGYTPYENPDAAIGRRNVVLSHMAELGYITKAEYEESKKDKLRLAGLQPKGISQYKAPWFVTYVMKELTKKYGADLLYRGGLRVHTTLNYEMQKVAEEELQKGVRNARSRKVTQGALICIDPETGYIKAMVGSANSDFAKDQYNRATQAKRQPGSSFKAFVYTAAIDEGFDPNYHIDNTKLSYPGTGGRKGWSPKNFDGRYSKSLSMKMAIANSVNVCAVRMAEQIGISKVIMYAHMMGITSRLDPNLSLALGTSVVTPIEMCSAYGVFAAKGILAEPTAIVRINESDRNDDGGLIEETRPKVRQVLSEQTAQLMDEMFRGVVTMGTGTNASGVRGARGKTGTTQDDRDAWFVGYTPELSTTVWVGNDDNSPMRNVWGGNVCAPAWSAFMRKALVIHEKEHEREKKAQESNKKQSIPLDDRLSSRVHMNQPTTRERATVTICRGSGLLATRDCPSTYEVVYDLGKEPTTFCSTHRGGNSDNSLLNDQIRTSDSPSVADTTGPSRPGTPSTTSDAYITVTICADSGQVANEYCPETVSRRFLRSEAPSKVCKTHKGL